MKPSATTLATDRARALRLAGRDVITLTFGEPDFDTPDNVKRAAVAAMERGETKYTPVAGIAPLRDAIRAKFQADYGLGYGDNEVLAGVGAKQMIFNAFLATIDSGDEVVVPTPFWPSYNEVVALAGGTIVTVPTRAAEGFRLAPAALEAAITARTKWLVLTTPSNPSGAVYTAAEIAGLAAVLERHPHVWLLADTIYEHLVFGEHVFVAPAAAASSLRERTLTVNGVSKGHAMTGWRIGYAVGPAELIGAMVAIQGQQTSGACSVAQWAAVEALENSRAFLEATRTVFQGRRNRLVGALNTIDGLCCHLPDGSFYVFPDVGGVIGRRTAGGTVLRTDGHVVNALLEEAGVGAVAGAVFGLSPFIRLSFAAATDTLDEAADRIRGFCATLRAA